MPTLSAARFPGSRSYHARQLELRGTQACAGGMGRGVDVAARLLKVQRPTQQPVEIVVGARQDLLQAPRYAWLRHGR